MSRLEIPTKRAPQDRQHLDNRFAGGGERSCEQTEPEAFSQSRQGLHDVCPESRSSRAFAATPRSSPAQTPSFPLERLCPSAPGLA
jgi:hypothetical protein